MFKKYMMCWVLLGLSVIHSADAQTMIGRHEEKTPRYGRVYFMIPEAYAMCMEETIFMTEISNLSYLDAFTYRRPITSEQMEKMMKGEDFIVIPTSPPDESSRKPEHIKALMERVKGVTRRPRRVAETVIAKYNVRDFPSFIYLAPDLKVYKFDMPFCTGKEVYRTQFRNMLGEFISGKRRTADRWTFGDTSQPEKNIPQ